MVYHWDEIAGEWIEKQKQESFYDAYGYKTQGFIVNWDANTSQWINATKVEYTYDANGNEIQYIYFQWNKTTSEWDNVYKNELAYGTDHTWTQVVRSNWDTDVGQWKYHTKTTNYYSIQNATKSNINSTPSGLIIYPNPVNGIGTVKYPVCNSIQIEIYNTSGLLQKTIRDTGQHGETQIDFSNLNSGIYFWRLIDADGNIYSGKIMKK